MHPDSSHNHPPILVKPSKKPTKSNCSMCVAHIYSLEHGQTPSDQPSKENRILAHFHPLPEAINHEELQFSFFKFLRTLFNNFMSRLFPSLGRVLSQKPSMSLVLSWICSYRYQCKRSLAHSSQKHPDNGYQPGPWSQHWSPSQTLLQCHLLLQHHWTQRNWHRCYI